MIANIVITVILIQLVFAQASENSFHNRIGLFPLEAEDSIEDYEQLLYDFLLKSQNEDGGFSIKYTTLYDELFDTYYVVDCKQMLYEYNDWENEKEFLESITEKELLDENNIFALKNCYYYWNLCSIIGAESISEEKIEKFMYKLVDANGLVYNSVKDEHKEVTEYFKDLYYIETFVFGHRLLQDLQMEVDVSGLREELINLVDYNNYSSGMLCMIEMLEFVSDLAESEKVGSDIIREYISNYIKRNWNSLAEGDLISVATIDSIYSVLSYEGISMEESLLEKLYLEWNEDEDWNLIDWGMRVVSQILHIQCIENTNVTEDADLKDRFENAIKYRQTYKGSYYFMGSSSNMYSTYFAMQMLLRMNEKIEVDSQIFERAILYLQRNSDEFYNLETGEQLFYLLIRSDLNIPEDKINLERLFSEQFEILSQVSIINNTHIIKLLLQTADAYHYEIVEKENILSKLTDELAQYDMDTIPFILECDLLYIQSFLEEELSSEKIEMMKEHFMENMSDKKITVYDLERMINVLERENKKEEIDSLINTYLFLSGEDFELSYTYDAPNMQTLWEEYHLYGYVHDVLQERKEII